VDSFIQAEAGLYNIAGNGIFQVVAPESKSFGITAATSLIENVQIITFTFCPVQAQIIYTPK